MIRNWIMKSDTQSAKSLLRNILNDKIFYQNSGCDEYKRDTDILRDNLWTVLCMLHNLPIEKNMNNDEQEDMVNHPSHYQGNNLESIDVIQDFGLNFCLGNAVKYILRCERKGNKREDLLKAIWYLQCEIQADEDNE